MCSTPPNKALTELGKVIKSIFLCHYLRSLALRREIHEALVDVGNLVSVRHAMPVAVFDGHGVAGSIVVRFATGAKFFTDFESTESVHPGPGEVVFVDEDNIVSERPTLVLAPERPECHRPDHGRGSHRRRRPPRRRWPGHRIGARRP